MQPRCAVGPEFNFNRTDSETTPKWRSNRIWPVFCRRLFNLCNQRITRGEWARLLGRPSSKAALGIARLEIGIRLRAVFPRDGAAHTDLTSQGFPMHNKRGFAGLIQLLAFGTAVIGEKDEPVVFNIL
jgi:hypothetical protein